MIALRLLVRFALSLVILTMFPVLACAQSSAEAGNILFANDSKASTFPFEFRKGMIFVPVHINGSKPLSFVLDTGSSRILIDRALAGDLGLIANGSGSLQGAGSGRIPIKFINGVRLAFPGGERGG